MIIMIVKGIQVDIPSSLNDALGGGLTTVVRYGELFGAPESSVRNVQLVLGVYYYVLDILSAVCSYFYRKVCVLMYVIAIHSFH